MLMYPGTDNGHLKKIKLIHYYVRITDRFDKIKHHLHTRNAYPISNRNKYQ